MNGPDARLRWEEVEAWLAAARLDREAAIACLAAAPPLPAPAAFHCQQAAEKLLKGFLIHAARPFRKTHDMAELVDKVAPLYPEMAGLISQMQDWTRWAIAARYPQPGDVAEPQPAIDELRRAIAAVDALSRALRERAPARREDR
jgi:HEPN domain-containing protein